MEALNYLFIYRNQGSNEIELKNYMYIRIL